MCGDGCLWYSYPYVCSCPVMTKMYTPLPTHHIDLYVATAADDVVFAAGVPRPHFMRVREVEKTLVVFQAMRDYN